MSLAHRVVGDGPCVVLLHAGVADRRMWEIQADVLVAAGCRVVLPDLHGYGQSTPPEQPWSDVGDVRELLDDLGVGRSAFVGSSYGGLVSQRFAAAHPDRVVRLCLLCPASDLLEPDADVEQFAAEEDRLLEAGELDAASELNVRTWLGPDAGDEARSLLLQMQRQAFELQVGLPDEADSDDPPANLDAISCPTLVISGAHDLAPFRAAAARLAEEISMASHVELPWAGHLPSLERPRETAELVRDFVTG